MSHSAAFPPAVLAVVALLCSCAPRQTEPAAAILVKRSPDACELNRKPISCAAAVAQLPAVAGSSGGTVLVAYLSADSDRAREIVKLVQASGYQVRTMENVGFVEDRPQ